MLVGGECCLRMELAFCREDGEDRQPRSRQWRGLGDQLGTAQLIPPPGLFIIPLITRGGDTYNHIFIMTIGAEINKAATLPYPHPSYPLPWSPFCAPYHATTAVTKFGGVTGERVYNDGADWLKGVVARTVIGP